MYNSAPRVVCCLSARVVVQCSIVVQCTRIEESAAATAFLTFVFMIVCLVCYLSLSNRPSVHPSVHRSVCLCLSIHSMAYLYVVIPRRAFGFLKSLVISLFLFMKTEINHNYAGDWGILTNSSTCRL